MTDQAMRELLEDALTCGEYDDQVEHVSTFAAEGVMTTSEGLVIRAADGSEFQVTIVQSGQPR